MWEQLHKLMRGCHPKTGDEMDRHTNPDGTPGGPVKGVYSNLKGKQVEPLGQHDEKF